MASKKQVRQTMRKRLEEAAPGLLHERSAAICRLLLETPEFRKADALMIFLSMSTEADTSPVALAAWGHDKRVAAPRTEWDQTGMLPVEIRSLNTSDVQVDERGTRQPVSADPLPIDEIDLILVPGLAFDEQGNRLGRGRGFYDRFLAHPQRRAIACALAFEFQVVPQLDTDAHDIPVDMLVTDMAVRRFKRESE